MTWIKRRAATASAALAVRAAVSTATLAACGLLLVACSSSAASPSAQAKPSASASAQGKGMDAYRQCLAQHGVTMAPRPSGSGRPGGRPGGRPSGLPSGGARRPGGGGGFGGSAGGASADPAQRQAAQACASLRPQFNGRGGGDSTAMKAFTSCLKDHGVVLPSASPGAGGMRGFNTTDPKSAQAFGVCKALLPQQSHSGAPAPAASPTA
ncbi:hypothetical protein ACGFW5_27185 [Streptomyces sp. NPDC048416]|uniref:hypothetical protein n=1 Tax=Streptomyces sp. NPDC048416 TaxID=3365546 RepID=UPI0037109B7A